MQDYRPSPFLETALSREFEDAWYYVVSEPRSFAEFSKLPMPPGCRPEDLWHIFFSLEKAIGYSGVAQPWFKGIECEESWFFLPKSSQRNLFELGTIAGANTHVNEFVLNASPQNPILSAGVVDEIESLARRDGLSLTRGAIEGIWYGMRTPRNTHEAIIENLARAFGKVRQLAARSFSRLVIEDAHELIVGDYSTLDLRPQSHFDEDVYRKDRLGDPSFVSDQIDSLVTNARAANDFNEVVIASILLSNNLWDLPYVTSLRALTEYLVRQVYFNGRGLPALGYVPFSKLEEVGSNRYLRMHERESRIDTRLGINCTWLISGQIKAYLDGARMLETAIREHEHQEEDVKRWLEGLPYINARQQDFACMALSSPSGRYKIADYMKRYKVAYATAYSDLFSLVKMGILSCSRESRAHVFQGVTR